MNRQRLKDLDLLVLDNSIRESSVGQSLGHTVQDKWSIYHEVKKCRIPYIIIADLSKDSETVDDVFVQELVQKGKSVEDLFVLCQIDLNEVKSKKIPTGIES